MELNFGKADISLVNVVRRIILRDIYTYAIEKVTINENTSVMHDEMLTDRLALVPLRVTYNGAPPMSIKLSMSISCNKGTKNIYSRDIIYAGSTDIDINILYPNILLAVLSEGQCININAECKRGNGNDHNKFTPVTTVDVVKEGYNIKLYAELIGQLTKDEILRDINVKLNLITTDVIKVITESIDH